MTIVQILEVSPNSAWYGGTKAREFLEGKAVELKLPLFLFKNGKAVVIGKILTPDPFWQNFDLSILCKCKVLFK